MHCIQTLSSLMSIVKFLIFHIYIQQVHLIIVFSKLTNKVQWIILTSPSRIIQNYFDLKQIIYFVLCQVLKILTVRLIWPWKKFDGVVNRKNTFKQFFWHSEVAFIKRWNLSVYGQYKRCTVLLEKVSFWILSMVKHLRLPTFFYDIKLC